MSGWTVQTGSVWQPVSPPTPWRNRDETDVHRLPAPYCRFLPTQPPASSDVLPANHDWLEYNDANFILKQTLPVILTLG